MSARRFEDFEYRTRKSWIRARRVVAKAEILDKGQNPRFIVTNLSAEENARFEAGCLYEKFYCARGEMENRIKEAQRDLFAGRTSTARRNLPPQPRNIKFSPAQRRPMVGSSTPKERAASQRTDRGILPSVPRSIASAGCRGHLSEQRIG